MSNFRFNSADQSTVSRSLPDGGFYSCTVADLEYLAWVGAGNTPEPYVQPALTVADYIANKGMSSAEAAQKWIDENEATWKAWMP